MRVRFEQQLKLGITPISEVELDLRSRNGLLPVLRSLQYVFNTKALSEEIFQILEQDVFSKVKKTGRYGMSMWEILVLGVVRLSQDMDFDELHDLSNEHNSLRGILGVQKSDYTLGKRYGLQTIKDNVQLLNEETIYKISEIIVKGSHGMIKKKEGLDCLSLSIKADSFVVESNIHFPTDLNLLRDSLRKSLETLGYFISAGFVLSSGSKWKSWIRKTLTEYRIVSEIHRKKGSNYAPRLKASTKSYLSLSNTVKDRIADCIVTLSNYEGSGAKWTVVEEGKKAELLFFFSMVNKHIDLVNRRILLGETIPSCEKLFSIFEPHVEWNSKGKVNKYVELGHNTLVATDQYNFILYAKVYEKEVDKQQTIKIGEELEKSYGKTNELAGISFDKNFYSLPAEQSLEKKFKTVVLPKPGRPSKRALAKSENLEYQNLKRAHSGVEGNINQLEQYGLDKCPDKGIRGFKRYVAYGVLSYNLHKLGTMLIAEERKAAKKQSRAKRA
jgi:hypothetical protein